MRGVVSIGNNVMLSFMDNKTNTKISRNNRVTHIKNSHPPLLTTLYTQAKDLQSTPNVRYRVIEDIEIHLMMLINFSI